MPHTQAFPRDARALHRWALHALEESRAHDAVRALRQAALLAPGEAVIWNDLGVVLEALGHPTEALRCYRTALDREKDHPEAKDNYHQLRRQLAMMRVLHAQAVISTTESRPAGVKALAKRRAAATS